jgi:hypothetical protein
MSVKLLNKQAKPWKPTRTIMRGIEEQAILLRQRAKVDPLERFDPRSLTNRLEMQLVQLPDVAGLSPESLDIIYHIDPQEWSGMGGILPNGRVMVILNPNMTIERENVTIMEEVAHAHYGHKPSQLRTHPTGLEQRTYDEASEREAYWTAAATLLPSKAVGLAVYRGQSAEDIAILYSTSVELAEMRIKTLRLWPHYNPSPLPCGGQANA